MKLGLKERFRNLGDRIRFNPRYRKISVVAGITFLSIIVLVFLIRPAVTGYSVYNKIKGSNLDVENFETQFENMQRDLVITTTNLSSCQSFYTETLNELDSYLTKTIECESKLATSEANLNTQNSQYAQENEKLKVDLSEKESDLNELQSDYDALTQNSANNICCKQRIDDSNINSYTIENNKIVCTTGGEKSISCP